MYLQLIIFLFLLLILYYFLFYQENFNPMNPCIQKCKINATDRRNQCENLSASDIATCVHKAYNQGINCEFQCQNQ